LQSRVLHSRFLSLLFRSGCAWCSFMKIVTMCPSCVGN
jgi:hypothetical protein